MEGEGGHKRAEIDTTAPFRSVKEAVSLFGEKALAGKVFAHKLIEIQNQIAEPKETKQNLQKSNESKKLANFLSSLQQELAQTKQELRHLNQRESKKPQPDIKIVEDTTEFEAKEIQTASDCGQGTEFQKKRNVTFANPHSLAVIVPQPQASVEKLESHSSLRSKKTKKPLIPLIGGIFSKKKS